MQPEFWHERWAAGQIGFHQTSVNPHLQRFWPELGLTQGSAVFVPLCGKSRDMLWLRSMTNTVVGVELSPLAVAAFVAEHALAARQFSLPDFQVWDAPDIRLYAGDFFKLTPTLLPEVRAVFDRAALVALPPEMRPAYVRHLVSLIVPGTRILLVSFDYPQQEMAGPPFSVGHDEVRTLFGGTCDIRELHRESILAQEPRFRDKGLTRLDEAVYLLTYNGGLR